VTSRKNNTIKKGQTTSRIMQKEEESDKQHEFE
jgi:hypothetical protein